MNKRRLLYLLIFLNIIILGFTVYGKSAVKLSSAKLEYDTVIYDGMIKKPKVSVKGGKENRDYFVTYCNNRKPGRATVIVDAINDDAEPVYLYFDIVPVPIDNAEIILSDTSYIYSGKANKPTVTVKCSGKKLSKNKSYTVSYSDNTLPGRGKVTVKGTGYYCKTVTRYFYIKPAKVNKIKASSVNTNSLKLSWKLLKGGNTYQVYSYRQGKWKRIASTSSGSIKLTSLKSDTVYKLKVRATADAGNKTLYGEFSPTVEVRTKTASNDYVYISRNGRVYHHKGCKSLSPDNFKLTYAQAKRQYAPCSKCCTY